LRMEDVMVFAERIKSLIQWVHGPWRHVIMCTTSIHQMGLEKVRMDVAKASYNGLSVLHLIAEIIKGHLGTSPT
jgi:hypothetical protein